MCLETGLCCVSYHRAAHHQQCNPYCQRRKTLEAVNLGRHKGWFSLLLLLLDLILIFLGYRIYEADNLLELSLSGLGLDDIMTVRATEDWVSRAAL